MAPPIAPVEPVAIIGMSCRLPDGVSSTSKLWDLLINGKSAFTEIPKSRLNVDAFYHPNANKAGTISGKGGYFIKDDVRLFDNAFFGINNLETKYMDSQQRQLLEVVYECFESAGVTLEEVSGANVGCYVANFTIDFVSVQAKDPDLYHRYSATGFGPTILANRISHTFDLRGPSLVLDTACSSSLYALHVACAALNAGECDSAIVAGANLVQSPEAYIAMTKAGVLSSTSISHTFDSSADGYGRGEGISALYLKRMDSVKVTDPVRSIIRGTAVNSNGRTPGIAMPGKDGQEAVIRKAYTMAGLPLDETPYVEAHGTGTPIGDPIEIEAISKCLTPKFGQPLFVGSVKTNVGHGEAVSGITSIIKSTLALENLVIPPTIGIQNLNPNLKLEQRNMKVVTCLQPWPKSAVERISINSFGYGGANAHAILDSARSHMNQRQKDICKNTRMSLGSFILPFSASNAESLTKSIGAVVSSDAASQNLRNLAYTLGSHRSSLSTRGYVLATKEGIDSPVTITTPQVQSTNSPCMPIAFIFTGQGAQWPRMGHDLLCSFPTFRKTIDFLDSYLATLPESPSWSLKGVILETVKESTIYQASRSQPICTAVQIGLCALLEDWGIAPMAVVGHSSGEICAAYAAGYTTAEEAIAIAYYRGLAVSKLATKGAMMAVGLDHKTVDQHISACRLEDSIRVACINSPDSTTVSGDYNAIDTLLSALQDQDIFVRKLKTDDKAYHSQLMKSIGQLYEDLLKPILDKKGRRHSGESKVKMFSSVNPGLIEEALIATPNYWRQNLESPVLFHRAMELLLVSGPYQMIEVGPHPALAQPVRDIQQGINNTQSSYSSTLSRGTNDQLSMLNLAGLLFLGGFKLPISRINGLDSESTVQRSVKANGYKINSITAADGIPSRKGFTPPLTPEIGHESNGEVENHSSEINGAYSEGTGVHTKSVNGANLETALTNEFENELDMTRGLRVIHDLPTYPWNHQDLFWNESRISSEYRNLKHRRHDLLGSRIPGTAGKACWWRNTLKLQEVSWIQDHKLGPTIVFPAAGYLAMAIEGLCQVQDYSAEGNITLKEVHILNLLVVESDGDGVELSMQLEPAKISNTSSSSIWWQFEISSRIADVLTIHANGLITVQDTPSLIGMSFPFTKFTMEEQASRTWYNKLAKEGLCFGPQFHSLAEISTDHSKNMPCVLAKTIYQQGGDTGAYLESEYLIHPVTIDAIIQAGIIGTAAGVVQNLKGKVPVVIGELNVLSGTTTLAKEVCTIRTICQRVGFESVLVQGQLESSTGQILAQIKDMRAIAYREPSLHTQAALERNPFLRILWKPSISTLSIEDSYVLGHYVEEFNRILSPQYKNTDLAYFAGAVDLITHKNGRTKILELSDDCGNNDLGEFFNATSIGGNHKHFDTYTRAVLNPDGGLSSEAKPLKREPLFDLVLVFSKSLTPLVLYQLDVLKPYLANNATFVFMSNSSTALSLHDKQLSMLTANPNGSDTTIIITRPYFSTLDQNSDLVGSKVILIYRDLTSLLRDSIIAELSGSLKVSVELVNLVDVTQETVPLGSTVISTLELENPILGTLKPVELQHLKLLSENASLLLWITGGSLYKASNPDFALVLGLSRSLMLERPSLKMPVFDLDAATTSAISAKNVGRVFKEVMKSEKGADTEYRQYEGVVYHSRFIPDVTLNEDFRRTQDSEVTQVPVEKAKYCKLGMKQLGQIDTLRFEEFENQETIPRGYVEVQVKAMGINAKDFYALTDKIDIRNGTCSVEFSGIITATGTHESDYKPGDRVVVMAPTHGGTLERVPEWACCKLNEDEDFATMATIPVVFATGLYALEDRARLETGQTILIHSATGGAGIAAIQIAQLKGAEIFATVGTDAKKAFLVENFNIPSSHIFDSHTTSFLPDILKATSGKGVDVVYNSLTGDLLKASWELVADFGTFIELGKRDIADSGLLDMRMFSRGVTFTALDLSEMYWSEEEARHRIVHRMLHRSVDLLREGKIRPISPLKVFPASQIVQAFRYFASSTRMGKVALTFSPSDNLSVVPLKYRTRFHAHKTYLLVGCLGGLGRSLAQWMLQRGARKFIFMGRSGTSKLAAKNTVAGLRAAGAEVEVVQGDVACYSDVERAVMAAKGPIGGLVHAAMSIHVALFNETTNEKWHAGMSQKVQGTWNLYKALSTTGNTADLDFLLLLSSMSGSVGTATESNYCAGNAFQDAFGAHLRSLGLPGVSLGLGMVSEVGFLHERPDTEAILLRKGLHPLTEEEFLQLVDGAITTLKEDKCEIGDIGWGTRHYMEGHILTGLELHGFQKNRDMGFMRGMVGLEDPRFTYIAGAFAQAAETDSENVGTNGKSYPRAIASALAKNESKLVPDEELIGAIATVVIARIATLLLVPPTQLQASTHLADFGMESMLAAEFRADMFRAFKVDVPFAVLMAKGTQMRTIAEAVGQGLLLQK